eukprot:gene25660-biopygen3008
MWCRHPPRDTLRSIPPLLDIGTRAARTAPSRPRARAGERRAAHVVQNHKGITKASQRNHKGITKESQRTHKGTTKEPQRIHKGTT